LPWQAGKPCFWTLSAKLPRRPCACLAANTRVYCKSSRGSKFGLRLAALAWNGAGFPPSPSDLPLVARNAGFWGAVRLTGQDWFAEGFFIR